MTVFLFVFAWGGFWFLQRVTWKVIERWVKTTTYRWDDQLVSGLKNPFRVLAFALSLLISSAFVHLLKESL